MGAGWSGDVIQSHDGSRLAQWEQKLLLLPPWLRPLKRGLIGWLPRYREFRALMARQYGDPRRLVIAVSKRVAGDYQRYHGVRPSQIRVVYHGVDTERFSPERCAVQRASTRRALGFSEEETVLLLAAHNFALKGLATMIRALGRLRGGEVRSGQRSSAEAGPDTFSGWPGAAASAPPSDSWGLWTIRSPITRRRTCTCSRRSTTRSD